MRRHWLLRGLKFFLFAVLFIAVFSFFVMRLWNWLMPAVFGWHAITFWQALGLLVLSKILFGFRGGPHRHWGWKRRMMERWDRMSPEEREKFRESMHGCGMFASHGKTSEAKS